MNHLIGMTVEEAKHFCKKIRVVREDGEDFVITMDYIADRLNVEITSGKISKLVGWY